MRFFFDNNVPLNIARGLRELEPAASSVDIVHCRERWPPLGQIDDIDWIPEVTAEERTIITFDRRILTNPLERKAYQDAGATLLVPARSVLKSGYWDKVVWLVRRWTDIKDWVENERTPGAYQVQASGRVRSC